MTVLKTLYHAVLRPAGTGALIFVLCYLLEDYISLLTSKSKNRKVTPSTIVSRSIVVAVCFFLLLRS